MSKKHDTNLKTVVSKREILNDVNEAVAKAIKLAAHCDGGIFYSLFWNQKKKGVIKSVPAVYFQHLCFLDDKDSQKISSDLKCNQTILSWESAKIIKYVNLSNLNNQDLKLTSLGIELIIKEHQGYRGFYAGLSGFLRSNSIGIIVTGIGLIAGLLTIMGSL